MRYAIGIDIGGTKISMVLGNHSGKILARRLLATKTGRQTKLGLREIVQSIKLLLSKYPVSKKDIAGIGVGIPGPVDSGKGIVPKSPHLGGWEGLPLAKYLQKEIKLPVTLANDANAAAIGEKIFGQGRRVRHFIYMTISTGIGGGVVVHGKLLEGASFVAGEVGHMTIVPQGDLCKCGKKGCLEAYASGTAIASYAAGQIKKGRRSKITQFLTPGNKITARMVGLAAASRDPLALETYRRAGFYLGVGIANLLNVINPKIVILGGGVLKSAPKDFWREMLASARREAWPQAYQAVKIVRTKLGDHVGELGALALAFDSHKINLRP